MTLAADDALRAWSKTRGVGPLATTLGELPTPALVLSRAAYRGNIRAMQDWCDAHGFLLEPHGKTTMAPRLWEEQLDAGAWGITVATESQLRFALAAGVPRIQLANPLIRPEGIAECLAVAARQGADVLTWVDSASALERLEQYAPAGSAPRVLVELGNPGGRTGVRGADALVRLAERVAGSARVRLAGVSGYEGAIGAHEGQDSLDAIREYVAALADASRRIAPLVADGPAILSVGGTAHLDVVGAVLVEQGLPSASTRVVLRSGVSIVHDDGYYEERAADPLPGYPRFRSALRAWSRVLSTPEPGLALLDAGRRDVPYDQSLPVVLAAYRGQHALALPQPLAVRSLNDQHAFVDDPGSLLAVGDLVMLGLSHPCSAFDRWAEIPVVAGEATPDAPIVDLLRTFF